MSTHVALAKQIISQFQISQAMKNKAEEYKAFEIEMACKIMELREEEEVLSTLLDEHTFLAATLDKKRSIAITKENLEKKQKNELTDEVTKLKSGIIMVEKELQDQTNKIQGQIQIKNLILQTKQEEGINTIEYIESQIYMNQILKEAILTISEGTRNYKPITSTTLMNNSLPFVSNQLKVNSDTDSLTVLAEYSSFLNSIHVMHKAMSKAVNIKLIEGETTEDCKKAMLNIQSLIKDLESVLNHKP